MLGKEAPEFAPVEVRFNRGAGSKPPLKALGGAQGSARSRTSQFLFEAEWNKLAPIALRVQSFRRVAPEFGRSSPEARTCDLSVKLLLLFTKVLPKHATHTTAHDFLAHFSPLQGGVTRQLCGGH